MKLRTRILFTLLLLAPFASIVSADEAKKESKEAAIKQTAPTYRLQQTDVIEMTIFQEGDMKTQSLIGKSGTVSFPLIGAVMVKGLTVPELESKLKALYEKDYLVNAKVNVLVTSYAKKWVTVSGAVENPGKVPYPEDGTINLASAVAIAGGIQPDGNSNSITLARKKGGSQKCTLSKGGKITLMPGDTVVVPRLPVEREAVVKTATVSGQVRKPGMIGLPRSGKVDILTAIAQAGGYSKIANQKTAILQRKTGNGHRPMEINVRDIRNGKARMVHMYEGDILIIKESRF